MPTAKAVYERSRRTVCAYLPRFPNRSAFRVADTEQLVRQWRLLRSLAARRLGATLEDLAAEGNASTRTIRRDLVKLREVGFPLIEQVGDHGRKRWRLDDAEGLVNLKFTLEEAAALFLGRQFLEPLVGTMFHAGAHSAFEKIRATMGEAALRHLERLAAGFYHAARGWTDYASKAALIDDLVRAIEDRRLAAIEYRSLSSTEPVSQYDLYPLSLVYWRGALYLVAQSPSHKAVRTFKLDRISNAQVLTLPFAEPIDFDAAHFFEHSFGIFQKDGEPIRVRVAFRPQVVRLLEERQFHPSQRLTRRKDGRVVAEFRLTALEDFVSWVLSFGPLAEVLEPVELREDVARSHRDAASIYGPALIDSQPVRSSRRS
jgi:predicted DNA-binding transcriptional regulator YafY